MNSSKFALEPHRVRNAAPFGRDGTNCLISITRTTNLTLCRGNNPSVRLSEMAHQQASPSPFRSLALKYSYGPRLSADGMRISRPILTEAESCLIFARRTFSKRHRHSRRTLYLFPVCASNQSLAQSTAIIYRLDSERVPWLLERKGDSRSRRAQCI